MLMDIEDDEFNDLLADKRHRELSGSLKKIAVLLSQKDDGAMSVIKSNMDAFGNIINLIKTQQKEVTVTVNNNELLPLLREIKEGNDRILTAMSNKPIVSTFIVENTDRYTKTIEVIYKKASQATFKK